MMYTIDKDSSRDCIYVLKKRFIATQNIKGELDFCWSRTTTTFSSFSKDFFSHSNIYWMWAAAWEERCYCSHSVRFARLLRELLLLAERKRGLSPPHSLQSSFCLNPYWQSSLLATQQREQGEKCVKSIVTFHNGWERFSSSFPLSLAGFYRQLPKIMFA